MAEKTNRNDAAGDCGRARGLGRRPGHDRPRFVSQGEVQPVHRDGRHGIVFADPQHKIVRKDTNAARGVGAGGGGGAEPLRRGPRRPETGRTWKD